MKEINEEKTFLFNPDLVVVDNVFCPGEGTGGGEDSCTRDFCSSEDEGSDTQIDGE